MLVSVFVVAVAATSVQTGSANRQEQSAASACLVDNLNAPMLEHLIISRTTGVPVPSHPREEATSKSANSGKALGYTRIRASFVPCTGFVRRYSDERRSAVKRFFFGKNAEKLLTLNLLLKPGDLKFGAPLTFLTRHSRKQGEEWATTIQNDRILTPYFRADLGSHVTLEAAVKSTRDYDATVAADVLDLVSRASALITPTSAIITTENREGFNTAATFVDTAVDGLLKVGIDEKVLSDAQLYPGENGIVLAVLTVTLPMANNTFPNVRFPNVPRGQWIIYAERLRQSMLGDIASDGKVERSSTSPGSVLNYLVAEKKTLRESLSGSKSVTTARDALVAATDAALPDKARALCRAVAAEAELLGLAPADVGASMWAYLHDLALPATKMAAAEPGCSNLENYPALTSHASAGG